MIINFAVFLQLLNIGLNIKISAKYLALPCLVLRSKGNNSANSSWKCSGISRSRGQNDINGQSQSRRILWNSVFLIWHDHCIFKVTIAASGCTRPAKYQGESFPAWIQNGLQKKKKKTSRKQLATDCCHWRSEFL